MPELCTALPHGYCCLVLLLKPPGVYRPQSDTDLLGETLLRLGVPDGAHVLDVGTGVGALAVEAIRAGAGSVTAVDVCRRAVLTTWFNTRLRRLPVHVEHGRVPERVAGRVFDVIVANPPYVPAERLGLSPRGRARAWDAGPYGRALLDPLCTQAPRLLSPGGMLLVVHSELSGIATTLATLRAAGMNAEVVARRRIPFGPVLRRRVECLRRRDLIGPQQRHEELVVIRGDRPR